jgi:hypothetical protein
MLTDGTDEGISSKRAVTLLAFVLCAVAFVANLFFNFTIDESIFEGMMYIAIAGLGVVCMAILGFLFFIFK